MQTGKLRTDWVGSETDVLVVLHRPDAGPFALHIENKLAEGMFMPDQAERYRSRAKFWLGNPKYGSYTDFVIAAPQKFLTRWAHDVQKFDLQVSMRKSHCTFASSALPASSIPQEIHWISPNDTKRAFGLADVGLTPCMVADRGSNHLYFNPLSCEDDGVVPPQLALPEICHRRKP
jgi:hypothetical protein